MSRHIWDGHDYLEKVYDRWLDDGGFSVAELKGEIIGCVKLTRLPDKVLCLRVYVSIPAIRAMASAPDSTNMSSILPMRCVSKILLSDINFAPIT